MEPDEIKQRLDEVDAKLRTKLAELGFTPEEIERQLDRSIPDEQKQAERENVLARKFAADLNDPNSGLMDAILSKVADDIERQHPEIAAARRRKKRMQLAIGGVVAVVVVGIAVWYFVLRDATSSCAKLVGPIAALEELTGAPLEMRSGYESEYRCYQYVDRRGRAGGSVVNIETAGREALEPWMRDEGARKFVDKLTFPIGTSEAVLFVAGESPKVSPEEMLADAQSRVGKTSDPMGAVLSNLPPSQHVVLFQAGSKTVKLVLDRALFTVDKAKTYSTAVARRASK